AALSGRRPTRQSRGIFMVGRRARYRTRQLAERLSRARYTDRRSRRRHNHAGAPRSGIGTRIVRRCHSQGRWPKHCGAPASMGAGGTGSVERRSSGMSGLDLVIRGGTVIDGMGAEARTADVGIAGGRIVEIGAIAPKGARIIDAERHAVTPGFIDAHTHMDAQMHWDPIGTNSCWHGVTTV